MCAGVSYLCSAAQVNGPILRKAAVRSQNRAAGSQQPGSRTNVTTLHTKAKETRGQQTLGGRKDARNAPWQAGMIETTRGKGELQKSRGKSGGKNDEAGLFHVKQYIHKGQQLISGSSVKR